MTRIVDRSAVSVEVKRLHDVSDARDEAVKKLHDVPFRQAKADVGAAIRVAIGDRPLKEYGHESLISEVCSGAKVPEYLARICDDVQARRRLGIALLKGTGVRFRTVAEWDDEQVG